MKILYPPKGLCKADTEGGPIVFTYVLFWVRKTLEAFQFTNGFLPFWNLENTLSPPRDVCLQTPVGAQLFFTFVLFGLGNVYWTFNLQTVFCLFENLKMFYPPKGLCKADTEGGPIVFYLCLISVRKRILDFQNPHFQAAFLRPPECFIPRRDSAAQSPKGVQLFLLMFYLV